MSSASRPFDVAIIGAGPAGLALARLLQKRGVTFVVLERDQIGSTWCQVPESLRVLSPWWTNSLDLRSIVRHAPTSLVSAREYRDYLREFAARSQIPIELGASISSVTKVDSGWQANAEDGRFWSAKFLVCATGYFSAPVRDIIESDRSIDILHSADIGDYGKFVERARGRRVVIVGKRVTAGQLAVELHARNCEVFLASRAPIQFRRVDFWGRLRENLYFVYEELKIRFNPNLKANSHPDMDGGSIEGLISSGLIRAVARPKEVKSGVLHLVDGSQLCVDVIILATGYRPALDYLGTVCDFEPVTGLPALSGLEVAQAPGVFIFGFDNIVNFRSRALRGIRADVRLLVKKLLSGLSEC
jgi:putative flavoprotein involved in K+ transport